MAESTGKPFGTTFGEKMTTVSWTQDDGYGTPELVEVDDITLHPGAHVLHYGSAVFEGLKAHRGDDGVVRIFRLDRHVERMQRSATFLCLPEPPRELTETMIIDTVKADIDEVPDAPGALYIRPTMIGTEINIGAAAHEPKSGLFYILTSPVGAYFEGDHTLRIAIETKRLRSTPGFGEAKAGANYAMALRIVREAEHMYDTDQVLFAPDGQIEETGAANFLLISDDAVVTPPTEGNILNGVTRDSILTLAHGMGYDVAERPITVSEATGWGHEAALSGTAAVLAPVGTLIHDGIEYQMGNGKPGPNTLRLRDTLRDIQLGRTDDAHGWVRPVT
ncbi:MAG: branched-chain amino acid aminotransferase [Acidimicrobiia bacterium]|nr:branched-chain amino acid aminotransferase [Acidimicrobiia bacterium]